MGKKFSHGYAGTAYKADDFCLKQKHRLFIMVLSVAIFITATVDAQVIANMQNWERSSHGLITEPPSG